jgi:hypothetical protein
MSVYLKGTTYWYTTSGTIDSVSSFPEGVNLLVQLIPCLVYLKGTTYSIGTSDPGSSLLYLKGTTYWVYSNDLVSSVPQEDTYWYY